MVLPEPDPQRGQEAEHVSLRTKTLCKTDRKVGHNEFSGEQKNRFYYKSTNEQAPKRRCRAWAYLHQDQKYISVMNKREDCTYPSVTLRKNDAIFSVKDQARAR